MSARSPSRRPGRSRRRRPTRDEENMNVAVEFEWVEVGVVRQFTATLPAFPNVPAGPGVYRFRVSSNSGVETYIGEAENIRQRLQRNYGSQHTGSTNVRVRRWLLSQLAAGGEVRLALAHVTALSVDGKPFAPDLASKQIR